MIRHNVISLFKNHYFSIEIFNRKMFNNYFHIYFNWINEKEKLVIFSQEKRLGSFPLLWWGYVFHHAFSQWTDSMKNRWQNHIYKLKFSGCFVNFGVGTGTPTPTPHPNTHLHLPGESGELMLQAFVQSWFHLDYQRNVLDVFISIATLQVIDWGCWVPCERKLLVRSLLC